VHKPPKVWFMLTCQLWYFEIWAKTELDKRMKWQFWLICLGNLQYRFDLILNSTWPITGSEQNRYWTKSEKKINVDQVSKLRSELRKHFYCKIKKNFLFKDNQCLTTERAVILTFLGVEDLGNWGNTIPEMWANSWLIRRKGQTGCRSRGVRTQAFFACFHATLSEVVYCSLKITQSTPLTSHFNFFPLKLYYCYLVVKLSLIAAHPQFWKQSSKCVNVWLKFL